MGDMRAIHWFRRDLRLTDNTALNAACRRADEVIPVYVVSTWKQRHRWTGPARQAFLCSCLESLDANLRACGSRLIIRSGPADEALAQLITETGAEALYWNRDVDPFGIGMELRVEAAARRLGCSVHVFKDIAMHERDEVLKPDGEPYRVFTPYSKVWHRLEKTPPEARPRQIVTPHGISSEPLPTLKRWELPAAPPGLLRGGEKAARQRLAEFLGHGIRHYAQRRDAMGGGGTSRLSQDLRHGLLSIREIYKRCLEAASEADAAGRKGIHHFLNELCWREFYFQILWHYPEVLEVEFNPKFRGLEWDHNEEALQAWKDGLTGFPIVDAAMRELATTGYMHNRARMITAMFLTKDLHLNWRLGESYFMQALADGEIASNNGGWQWSAGTGADAAPYFRIQNPWTQTRRHDPDGAYIKKFLPELAHLPPEKFFEPPADGRPLADGYPTPIVDHATERDRTLEIFARHGEQRPAGNV